jgi:hypothetical protein
MVLAKTENMARGNDLQLAKAEQLSVPPRDRAAAEKPFPFNWKSLD